MYIRKYRIFYVLTIALFLSISACATTSAPEISAPDLIIEEDTKTPSEPTKEPEATPEPTKEPPSTSKESMLSSNIITSGDVEMLNLESFDFITNEKGIKAGGDLYIRISDTSDCGSAEIWANFPHQGGGLFLFRGLDKDLSSIDIESMDLRDDDFSPSCVELIIDGVYLYKQNASPENYIIFHVLDIRSDSVSLSYIVIESKLPTQEVAIPDSFTLPPRQQIDVYDSPVGKSIGTFQTEISFTIVEEKYDFLHVSWRTSDGRSRDAWVKKDDVIAFLSGDQCPFIFTRTDYQSKIFSTSDGSQPKGIFSFDTLVDLSSESIDIEQTEAIMQDANNILFNLTGFVIKINNFVTVDFTEEQPVEFYRRDSIPTCYIAQKTRADIPDGLLVFSYGSENFARTMGGFSYSIKAPPTFKNHFVPPSGSDNLIYVMFSHYSHKYARCGYDETGETIISTVSIGGECRNQPGTACVMNNGYSMCKTAVNDLYATAPNYFSASIIIHEIMHPFGLHGNMDHYGSSICTQEMRKINNSWNPIDGEAEIYNSMCPYVYDNFVAGYRP